MITLGTKNKIRQTYIIKRTENAGVVFEKLGMASMAAIRRLSLPLVKKYNNNE
jgi:hypothetical protein